MAKPMAGRQKPASSIRSITAAQGVNHIFCHKKHKIIIKELKIMDLIHKINFP
jgi:hypothetical protein